MGRVAESQRTRDEKLAPEIPTIHFPTAADWEDWLAEHHAKASAIWIQFAKKGSGIPTVGQQEALDVALCYGWIDGQAATGEEPFWLQRFTPRRARSAWSKRNCGKAEALVAAGRMRPSGLREMEAAKADGRWESAYESASKITVPEDLRAKLEENPAARDFFATLKGANRYAILYRIHEAKRPETRARRIEKFVTMLAERKTIH